MICYFRTKITLCSFFILVAFVSKSYGQVESAEGEFEILQPYAPHWFISELLEWTPEKDKYSAFNRSTTALATKIFNKNLKVNDHAREDEAKIESLSVFGHTSNTPSQGSLNTNFYNFTYWEYCDLLVYWGGSSSEGIILAPAPGVVDAAHRHGVPVYGTVFFPPIVYGGKREWVYEFVQKDKYGNFPVADKLIETAIYYGFDGWFINQETGNAGEVEADEELATSMQELMLYIKNNSDIGVQWYDAMLNDGTVKWQHEINDKNKMFFQDGDRVVSDQMFLDFRFTLNHLKQTKQIIDQLGRDLYDVYAGIDVQTNGYESLPGYRYPHGANFDVIFPDNEPHRASLAFYVPSWTTSVSSTIKEFYKNESRFWVGENGDPSNTETDHHWKGVAHYVPAKSAITNLPFSTSFCTGQGYKYFVEGEDVTSPEWNNGWNNLTVQEIQPTWKWLVEDTNHEIHVGYDFTDAYNGGNCLKIYIPTRGIGTVPLYTTQLKVTDTTKFSVVYKKAKTAMLKMEALFSNGEKITHVLNGISDGWNIDTMSFHNHAQKEIIRIAIIVGSDKKEEEIKIGKIEIFDKNKKDISRPYNVQIMSSSKVSNTASVAVKWDESKEPTRYYRLYKIQKNQSKVFLGATSSNACYLSSLPVDSIGETIIGVERVSLGSRSSEMTRVLF